VGKLLVNGVTGTAGHAPLLTPRGTIDEAVLAFALRLRPTPDAQLLATWKSSSSDLYRVGRAGYEADHVVVKRTSSPEEAAIAFDALVHLAEVVDALGCADAATIRPLGLDRSLPALAMPYVPGVTLGDVLRRDPSQLRPLLGRVAVIMAQLHVQSRPEGDEVVSALATARDGVARALDGGRSASTRSFPLDPDDIVRRYMDYNPNNMLMHADGRVWLIDPPVRAEFATFHHDIAQFLYKCHKHLVTPPWNADRMCVAVGFPGSIRHFLECYFAQFSRPMGQADAESVGVFLASFSRSGSPRDSRRFKFLKAVLYGPLLRRGRLSTG
jgi:hypothetical protein